MPLPRRRMAVAAVYLGTFMATLAISIVTVALPAIQAGLKTDIAGLQWVVGSYALCLSAFMLSAGPLGDRYGRKRAWLSGVALFVIGSATSAMASSLTTLIAGCALQGVAGALVIPGALSILTQAFPEPGERAHVIGGWSSFSGISLIVGPMLGGLLVDTFGWPSIFLINLPVGAGAFLLGAAAITESADPDHAALDPLGQILSIVLLGTLTYGLITAGRWGWQAGPVLAAFGIAALAAVAFVFVEMRIARPVLPIDLFRDRSYAVVNAASFALGFAGYTSLFLFSLFLQQAQGWSATQAGWRMGPVFAAMALVASQFGRLAGRCGPMRLMVLGYALLGLSMLAMVSFSPTTPYGVVALLFMLLGLGMGLAVPATGAAAMQAAPRERTGAASATMNALRQSGMTIGIALLGAVMGAGAIGHMSTSLEAARIADASTLATSAVRNHAAPPSLDMAPETFEALLHAAVAHGFTMAAAVAGLFGVAMALLLVLVLPVRAASSTVAAED
jgi:MFS transporter, DHA2 family, methylenomycin A resistance protein